MDQEYARDLTPEPIPGYIKFGAYDDLLQIVSSGMFIPVFMTGLSRSGKTCMGHQVCAVRKREMIRVNITEETDEDDLLGSFRLQEGNTVWFDGPVVAAMRKGAILLLDEVDKASHKCMCLQPILEGSPVYLKKIGEVVYPADGFNIIATANTKGQGDERGKFLSSQLLDEAFLDRFSITIEHDYPPDEVEKKILKFYISTKRVTAVDEQFVQHLVEWASGIRKMYLETQSISDLVSTGRLIHIMKTYQVFKCPFKAVRYGIARFDESMKDVFWQQFTKIFPFSEGDLTTSGDLNSKRFLRRTAEDIDFSEFNARYKMPAKRTP